ncbi:unannotated protein [freshwater metagenome]|uniref:Unannotated protein n=1 Tax=freshwater metagenome TaxID=449393 RepID=A0A6J6Y1R5_9ZZZZ
MLSTEHQLRTFFFSKVDVVLHLVELRLVDHRTRLGGPIIGSTLLQGFNRSDKTVEKLIMNRAINKDARG